MNPSKRRARVLPVDLFGEIVGYLDITSDHFLPGYRRRWIRDTQFRTVSVKLNSTLSEKNATRHFVNGQLHSWKDRPAIEWPNGIQEWYCRGQPHRGHGKPAVVVKDVYQEWYSHGKRTETSHSKWETGSMRFIYVALLIILVLFIRLIFRLYYSYASRFHPSH